MLTSAASAVAIAAFTAGLFPQQMPEATSQGDRTEDSFQPRQASQTVMDHEYFGRPGRQSSTHKIASGKMMITEIDKQTVEKVYARWAPVYDVVFGTVFERGRRAVVAASERIGGRILEVGVGTGLSLPYYSAGSRVVGIDLSSEMLDKARQRVAKGGLSQVESLVIMDCERLDYPDDSFDVVTAQCVVNTVPSPEKALEEFARVVRPGGEIVLLNRIGADAGPRRAFERVFQPVANRFGWRSDFPWSRFDAWLATSEHDMALIERQPVPPFGHFSIIRFGKAPASVAADLSARPQLIS